MQKADKYFINEYFSRGPSLYLCGLLMLGSHYRFLSIDSKSHRQKGRSRVDTCVQKTSVGKLFYAVPDELNMEKEMCEAFIYALILKNKEKD